MEPLGDWIEVCPWKARHVLLIDAGNMIQAFRVGEKRELLQTADPADLIAVWSGQWSTTARLFNTPEAVAKVAEFIG